MTTVVAVDADSEYSLVITDAGELEARRPLNDEQIRRFTTADPDFPDEHTDSEYGLTVRAVLDRYATQTEQTGDQSRFKLATTTASAYQWHLHTHTTPDTDTDTDSDSDSGTDTQRVASDTDTTSSTPGSGGESASNLKMSERQRKVIDKLTKDADSGDTPTGDPPSGDTAAGDSGEAAHTERLILTGVHTLLTAVTTAELPDGAADNNIDTARDAVHEAIQLLDE